MSYSSDGDEQYLNQTDRDDQIVDKFQFDWISIILSVRDIFLRQKNQQVTSKLRARLHDQRDFEFAQKYDLPITQVIDAEGDLAESSSWT